jgi:hypothetical protein
MKNTIKKMIKSACKIDDKYTGFNMYFWSWGLMEETVNAGSDVIIGIDGEGDMSFLLRMPATLYEEIESHKNVLRAMEDMKYNGIEVESIKGLVKDAKKFLRGLDLAQYVTNFEMDMKGQLL